MRFLADAMLGSLATYLRMCGHDAAYALEEGLEDDGEVRALAREEGRTLLTRDRQLAERTDDSVLVESKDVEEQLAELHEAGVPLSLPAEPARCGRCNGALEAVAEDGETPEYAPDPGETDVWQCGDCGQYFWKGSHWERVAKALPD